MINPIVCESSIPTRCEYRWNNYTASVKELEANVQLNQYGIAQCCTDLGCVSKSGVLPIVGISDPKNGVTSTSRILPGGGVSSKNNDVMELKPNDNTLNFKYSSSDGKSMSENLQFYTLPAVPCIETNELVSGQVPESPEPTYVKAEEKGPKKVIYNGMTKHKRKREERILEDSESFC